MAGDQGSKSEFDGIEERAQSPASLDTIQIGSQTMQLPTKSASHKEKKIGHRRVNKATGEVTYKKTSSMSISGAIQLGIAHSVGQLTREPERDILIQDFETIEIVSFPSDGTTQTPQHDHGDFIFQSVAPLAMRYFRDIFDISVEGFLNSIAAEPLVEVGNPGASGSLFWLTHDDEFIIKTLQTKESEFLQRLLPGYYMNVQQNPRTLLPKFYGLYCVKTRGKHIRIVVMNNLLPRDVKMNYKYDLKGSTLKRKASEREAKKQSPTFKDLDFMESWKDGIILPDEVYSALMKTIERDCRVLESFRIMDYSFLMGIHEVGPNEIQDRDRSSASSRNTSLAGSLHKRQRNLKSFYKRSVLYSAPMEMVFSGSSANLQYASEYKVDQNWGGIPAFTAGGQQIMVYCGIIDILQCYKMLKKIEHFAKSIVYDGDTVSVHRPDFYSQRYQKFLKEKVFRPARSVSAIPTIIESRTHEPKNENADEEDHPRPPKPPAHATATNHKNHDQNNEQNAERRVGTSFHSGNSARDDKNR